MWINELVEGYLKFLREHLKVKEAENGWYSIVTPFLNNFNDYIEVYVRKDGEKITLSDGGETLQNLELLDLTFSRKSRRKNILESILRNYGVEMRGDELMIVTDTKKFACAKHSLISAIIGISDLSIIPIAKTTSEKIFTDNVQNYFKELDVISTPRFTSKGMTGLEMVFDFQIAGRKTEMLINVFANMQQNNTSLFLFGWNDIREARKQDTGKEIKGMAIINDENNPVKVELLEALTKKNAEYILWSQRHNSDNVERFKNVA